MNEMDIRIFIFIRNVNNDGQALLTVMADTAWQKRSSGVQYNSPSGKYIISQYKLKIHLES